METLNTQLQKKWFNMPGFNTTTVLAALAKFFGWIGVILLPIKAALLAVSFLVLADFITGVWASIKEKKKITSHGLRRTVIKTLAYQLSIVVAFVLETYLLQGIPVVKVVSGLIAVTEGKSFFENLHRITGIDFWSEMVSKLNLADIKSKLEDKKDK